MKAFYCTTCTTDIARTESPLINEFDYELYTDLDDFRFGCMLRFMGIKPDFPDAKFIDNGFVIEIVAGELTLFRKSILSIDTEGVELGDEEDEDDYFDLGDL